MASLVVSGISLDALILPRDVWRRAAAAAPPRAAARPMHAARAGTATAAAPDPRVGRVAAAIRTVPDFPKRGVSFKGDGFGWRWLADTQTTAARTLGV